MKTFKFCAARPDVEVGHINLNQDRVARPVYPRRRARVLGHLLIPIMVAGILLSTAGLHASDNRMVGQFRVNLDPVHDWMQTRKGDRPMPHWRNFSPLEYLGVINGGHAFRVAVARDGGAAPRLVVGIHGDGASRHLSRSDSTSFRGDAETKEILLKNPPPTMLRLGMQTLDLKNRLGRAESTELAARRGAAVASANANTANWAHPYNRRAAANAEAAHAARARAQTVRELSAMERQNLERELARIRPLFRETHELGMSTGQIVAGREVWDCGVRAR